MDRSTRNNFDHNDVTNNDNLGILLASWKTLVEGSTKQNALALDDARSNPAWDIREFLGDYRNIWAKNNYDDVNPGSPN